jgi:hypothetical protein
MKTRLILAIALLLVCAGAGAARAEGTPDGLPPALETVCDMEQGSAFGHCNAYCEAMDCDSDNPQASATACDKVRSKFLQTTGRDVPCEVSCPCADPAVSSSFAAVLSGATPVNTCTTEGGPGIFINPFVVSADAFSAPTLGSGEWFCGGGFFPPVFLPISPEQGQFCADLLEQAANSQNVTCQ